MSMYSVGFLLGPAVGPVAGSFLAAAKGWRWVFWLLLILVGDILYLLVWRMSLQLLMHYYRMALWG